MNPITTSASGLTRRIAHRVDQFIHKSITVVPVPLPETPADDSPESAHPQVSLSSTYWVDGTRYTWHRIPAEGTTIYCVSQPSTAPQFGQCLDGKKIPLHPGESLICHGVSLGKRITPRLYVRADEVLLYVKELPKEVDLTPQEALLLAVSCAFKAVYGGGRPRDDEMHRMGVSAIDQEVASQGLKAKRLLDARGGVTAAGRNARPSREELVARGFDRNKLCV